MRSFDKRPIVENSQRISASVFVRNFFFEYFLHSPIETDSNRRKPDLKNEIDIQYLLKRIETESNINLKQEIKGKIEFTKSNEVKLTYTKSNLGRGFVFWFICQVCGRKVRYLYIPPNSQITACRICHRLAYDKQNDNKRIRSFNKLFR